MRGEQSEVIETHEYVVKMLPATKGYKLLMRIVRMVGPSIGIIVDGVGLSGVKADEDFLQRLGEKNLGDRFFRDSISVLMQHADEGSVEHVIKTLSEATTVKVASAGKFQALAGIFELHFQGEALHMSKWLGFALRAQFGDFWSALANAVPQGSDETKAADDQ